MCDTGCLGFDRRARKPRQPLKSDAAVSEKPLKVIKRMDFACELECDEPDTKHWRHPWCTDNNGGRCVQRASFLPDALPNIIPSLLKFSVQSNPDSPFQGTRNITKQVHEGKKTFWYKDDFTWRTFKEVYADIEAASKGLLKLDNVAALKSVGKCCAAILADTSADWQMCAQAAFQVGIPITTVYTTLGHEAMVHGLNETECPVLFMDWSQYSVLEKPVLIKCLYLKHIVFIGKCWVPAEVVGGAAPKPFPSPAEAAATDTGHLFKLTTLDGLIEVGSSGNHALTASPKSEDMAFIMYTSGSTGMPKGVMLSHLNFMAVVAGIEAQNVLETTPKDVYIAYLPLAHIFELVSEHLMMTVGANIGYGSPKTLTSASPFMPKEIPEESDLLKLTPSFMIAVPAILDVIKNGLQLKLGAMEGFKGKLVRTAVKHAQGLDGGEHAIASLLSNVGLMTPVLNKVKAQLGLGNIRVIASGGAPLSASTQEFITAVLCPVAQGYGCTETTGGSTVQEVFATDGRPADRSTGKVGPSLPSGEVKLRSVPDMGYLVTDDPPKGEVLLSGYNVSQMGYFKMKEKTEEDFPVHGDGRRWFHTGDIGMMTENGTLKIIDRKKDLIKLASGEYVALGKVEAALKQVPGIGACVVFARPDKDHTVAIVSQPERGWASVGGKPDEATLLKAIEPSLRGQKLVRFEIPAKVKVDDTIWTAENGLTTASMKLQRNPLRNHYNGPGGLLEQLDYRFS